MCCCGYVYMKCTSLRYILRENVGLNAECVLVTLYVKLCQYESLCVDLKENIVGYS